MTKTDALRVIANAISGDTDDGYQTKSDSLKEIADALENGGGSGGGSTHVTFSFAHEEKADKTYQEVMSMIKSGVIPYAYFEQMSDGTANIVGTLVDYIDSEEYGYILFNSIKAKLQESDNRVATVYWTGTLYPNKPSEMNVFSAYTPIG